MKCKKKLVVYQLALVSTAFCWLCVCVVTSNINAFRRFRLPKVNMFIAVPFFGKLFNFFPQPHIHVLVVQSLVHIQTFSTMYFNNAHSDTCDSWEFS